MLALLLAACVPHAGPGAPAGAPDAGAGLADAGTSDRALRQLLTEHWEWQMRSAPEWASALGDHRYDGEVLDRSVAAAEAMLAARRGFLDRARAMDASRMSARDQMMVELFSGDLEADVAAAVCRAETWWISPRMNAMGDLFDPLSVQALRGPADGAAFLARVRAWSGSLSAHFEALREGLASGRVANRTSVALVIEQVRTQAGKPVEDWPAWRQPEGWAATDAEAFAADLRRALEEELRPALLRYAAFLEAEILPAARGDDSPGLAKMPDGKACYEAQIRKHTTLARTAGELHQLGLDELARIHREFAVSGAAVFGVFDRAALFQRLRTDPALRFTNAEEIAEKAESALRKAEAAVPQVFGRLPKTRCVVSIIPAFEAPYTTIAYYRQPNPDGSKPGEYFINTFAPETRPRHEAEALAFHESVPGHHLQIAISYELPQVPAFLRYGGAGAFVEGWALYTERLADELHLYTGEVDRLGMLSFDAWRASRLVVDTGLHDLGWSREQAVSFMLQNTPLPENNIRNEVDRYITWPGQALAYKVGQIEIRALRAEAEAALGDRFKLAAFHDVVLGTGAVSLPVLRQRVEAWVAAGGPESGESGV